MPRTTVFSPEELAELSVALREVREIDDYCRHVRDVYREAFGHPNEGICSYHFYDGHLNLTVFPDKVKAGYPAMLRDHPFAQTRAWYETGMEFSHSAIYAEQFPHLANPMSELLEFFKGLELQLGTWAFEGRFLLGFIVLLRSIEESDYTDVEFLNFKILVPFWREGITESARYTRAQRLGGDFAALVENHPSGMFLFDGNRMVYANNAAKTLMQEEPRKGTELGIAELSEIPQTLIARRPDGAALLPFGKQAHIRSLPAWPELNLKEPWLAVVPEAPVELPLSERESAILRAYAGGDSADAAAKASGVAVSTYRTHLSNIAGKLGVSGSNAALTLWYLSGSSDAGRRTSARQE